MTYNNGEILMRVSKKIIKRHTNKYKDIDGNDDEVLVNVQSHWFGYISVGTKIKCQLPIKDKLLNLIGIKKLPTNMEGIVTSSSRSRSDIYAKFTRGKKTIVIKCDDIKYEIIERDLINDVYSGIY